MVTEGKILLELGHKRLILRKNDTVMIPMRAVHRVQGLTRKPARFIELAIGDCDENDIVRLDDDFGRGVPRTSQSTSRTRFAAPNIAIILAGGSGTRMRPITYEIPKALMPIHGKTLTEHLINLFKKYGTRELILSVGHLKEKIKSYFGDGSKFGVDMTYTEESEPLGTAGPIRQMKDRLTETFIVSNGDELKDIDIQDMYLHHKESGALVTVALTTVQDPSHYGVARLEGDRIKEFVEKPRKEDAPSNLINAGLYIMEPEVLAYIPKGASMLERDVFPRLAKEGKLFGYPFSGQWYDTGSFERYERALKEWKGIK
ncbi:Bifunctional protein GlmU [uncultured archaeon]|nr:Bifunctional protein GlmU [uncultured archaeon]